MLAGVNRLIEKATTANTNVLARHVTDVTIRRKKKQLHTLKFQFQSHASTHLHFSSFFVSLQLIVYIPRQHTFSYVCNASTTFYVSKMIG